MKKSQPVKKVKKAEVAQKARGVQKVQKTKKATQAKRADKKQVFLIVLVAVAFAAVLFWALGGVERAKTAYYGREVRAALTTENTKLGDPLKTLGFSDIKNKSTCAESDVPAGDSRLTCSAGKESYTVFQDEAAKTLAITKAKELSNQLKLNGWHQGDYEVSKWFEDVLNNKADYNPDAFHFKDLGEIFCVLDFFVAYSNPATPAIRATIDCNEITPGNPLNLLPTNQM